MSLYSATETLKRNLRASRKAIIGRGGEVSATAGLRDLPKAIFDIPAEASLAFYEDSEVKYRKSVPEKSEEFAMVKQIGGMTYKTKNLIPYAKTNTSSGITFTVNDDNTITLNGTAINNTSFVVASYKNKTIFLRSGITYTISCKSNLTESTGYVYISRYEGDEAAKTITIRNSAISYTPPMDGYATVAIVVIKGTVFDNEKIQIQLEEGATATAYEHYFEGLRDSKTTELVSEGANLAPSQEYGVHIPLVLKANTQYVVSVANPVSEGMQLLFYDENKTRFANVAVGLEDVKTGRRYRTFTLSQDCAYVMWAWATVTTVNEGQIEYGSKPSAYKPYIGTLDTKAIPEAVQSIDGYGWGVNADYNNHIEWRDGRAYFVKMVDRVDLGTLTWAYTTTGEKFFYAVLQGRLSGNKMLCVPYSTTESSAIFRTSDKVIFAFGSYVTDSINIRDLAYTDAETFTTAMQGVMLYYALATPIETDITHLFTEDNFLKVEGGGSVVAVNEYEYGVPSEIAYVKQVDESGGGEGDAYEIGYETGYGDGFSEGKTAITSKLTDLEVTENGEYTPSADSTGFKKVTVNVESSSGGENPLQTLIDAKGGNYLFGTSTSNTTTDQVVSDCLSEVNTSNIMNFSCMFHYCKNLTTVPLFDTRNGKDFGSMFNYCSTLTTVPLFDTRNGTNFAGMFSNCSTLTTVPLFDTRNGTNFASMFVSCSKLTTVPLFDTRNGTSFSNMFIYCKALTEIWIKNIKTNLTVGSGTSWGHLLTVDSLVHLCYELRNTGSAKTLTVGTANLAKLADVYVKPITITDEMRAEDDLIDEKLPFVRCESTDEGATLITDYVMGKNWSIK